MNDRILFPLLHRFFTQIGYKYDPLLSTSLSLSLALYNADIA